MRLLKTFKRYLEYILEPPHFLIVRYRTKQPPFIYLSLVPPELKPHSQYKLSIMMFTTTAELKKPPGSM